MEFKDKVKLADEHKNLKRRIDALKKEISALEQQDTLIVQQLEAEQLTTLLIRFVSESAWNRLSGVGIYTFADALALDTFYMPPGIGKKTRQELETALKRWGLKIPGDYDRRYR